MRLSGSQLNPREKPPPFNHFPNGDELEANSKRWMTSALLWERGES